MCLRSNPSNIPATPAGLRLRNITAPRVLMEGSDWAHAANDLDTWEGANGFDPLFTSCGLAAIVLARHGRPAVSRIAERRRRDEHAGVRSRSLRDRQDDPGVRQRWHRDTLPVHAR